MPRVVTHPPRSLSAVLDRVLVAMGDQGGYDVLPGMRLEVAWIQKRQCYQVLVEFRLADDADPSTVSPGVSLHRVAYEKRDG